MRQRLQLLEQAATEQLNARRNAEHALVEAQTRIAQLDQAQFRKFSELFSYSATVFPRINSAQVFCGRVQTEVTNVKQAQSARDATDLDAFTKGSKGAFEGSGKKQDSEVVCWYCEKKGHRASDCRKKPKDNDSGESKGSKEGNSKRKSNKIEFKCKCFKCGKLGDMSKGCRSKETSAFEAGDELASRWQASI